MVRGMLWGKAALGMRSQHLTDTCCLLHGMCSADLTLAISMSMLGVEPTGIRINALSHQLVLFQASVP